MAEPLGVITIHYCKFCQPHTMYGEIQKLLLYINSLINLSYTSTFLHPHVNE